MSSRYNPTIRSDNTRVQLSIDPNRDQRKFSSIAAFKQQVQKYKSQPKAVITSEAPKWKQDYLKANSKLQKKKYQTQKDTEKLGGFINFISPSTYIGPIFNNNGKSYTENVMSGEGTGNVAGNVAIDLFTPFAIGGVKNVASKLLPKSITVYKGGTKPFTRDYTFFTTDPQYASQFGPVQKYKLKYRNPAYTENPLVYKDMEGIHYYIDNERRLAGKPQSDIIIGHDKITSEVLSNGQKLQPSNGTEYVVWNPSQIKPKGYLKTEFKSELDWSPKSWFEDAAGRTNYTQVDVATLASHVPEYHEIERISKANGTWLKMPDGSTWKGDPRSWVQLMSKDGQKLSKQVWWHGDTDLYITKSGKDVTSSENGKRILWGSSEPHIARSYTLSDKRVVPIVLKEGHSPLKSIDAEGRLWRSAYKKGNEYYDTNTFSLENLEDGKYLIINNVIDKGSNIVPKNSKYYIEPLPGETYVDYLKRTQVGDDIIIGKDTPRKFLTGNNGNFNLNDSDVYKSIIPLIGIPYGASQYNN